MSMPVPDLTLGAYLRAIRARRSPEAFGFPGGGLRRVEGLRREEVAVLSDLSVDYYTRLEQGREVRPGGAVLERIADALELEGDERDHLFTLVGLVSPPRSSRPATSAPPALGQLIDSWTQPAFVINPAHDVLVANTVARAVHAPFERFDNLVRMVFLDPVARRFHADWARAAASTAASLRAATAEFGTDPGLRDLLVTMRERSTEFARLWQAQHVRRKTSTAKRFLHDEVGPLAFDAHAFAVQGAPGLQLVVYGFEPGSATAQSLTLLRAAATTVPAVSGGGPASG